MPPLPVVNLSEEVTSPARLQNRTCEFPRIRLLTDWILDTDTGHSVCMAFIMAVPMQQTLVAEFFPSTQTLGDQVINFNHICILEEEAAPPAGAVLLTEQCPFHPIKHGMVCEALTPVEEIAVVRTGRALDLDVSLDMRLAMFP